MPDCILMKMPCPRFSFSVDGWGGILCKKAHILSAFFCFQQLYWVLYLNHLHFFFTMEAAFQLILKGNVCFHVGRAEEECLSQKRKSRICQWCKPDRKGRKETGYSREDTGAMKNEPDTFSQRQRSSACNSVILSLLTEQIRPGAYILLCFEGSDRH